MKKKSQVKKDFALDLFHTNIPVTFAEDPELIEVLEVSPLIQKSIESTVTEKTKVIEALKEFVVDTGVDFHGNKIVQFSGGEIISTGSSEFTWKINGNFCDLIKEYKDHEIPELILNKLIEYAENKNVKVIFATDCLRQDADAFTIAYDNSQRMLSSIAKNVLKLENKDFLILPIVKSSIEEKFEQKWFDLFLKEIIFYKPIAIIGLGAKVVNFLTGANNRLADNHGELYKINLEMNSNQLKTILMPLFHPDFMEINKNTKKTAQKDLEQLYLYMQNNS